MARNGSVISGRVFATPDGPAQRPGAVLTTGSVQAPEELYWAEAEALALLLAALTVLLLGVGATSALAAFDPLYSRYDIERERTSRCSTHAAADRRRRARAHRRRYALRLMVLGQSAFSATFGLVFLFFFVFPALAQGLIAFAAAQAMGERADNQAYAERRSDGVPDPRA